MHCHAKVRDRLFSLTIHRHLLNIVLIRYYIYKMIRLNQDTTPEVLNEIKKGDLVTDTFSKTGLVEEIVTSDDGLYKVYEFKLVTGRVIIIKK